MPPAAQATDPLVRADFLAYIAAQEATTEQMRLSTERAVVNGTHLERIAVTLQTIISMQEKTYERLRNGMVAELREATEKTVAQCKDAIVEDLGDMAKRDDGAAAVLGEIRKGVQWSQIFIGVLGFALIVGTLFQTLWK